MSLKTLLFALGALALAACDNPSEPKTVDGPAMLVRPPLPTPWASRIAFTSTRDGNEEIYAMNADGSESVRLTDHPSRDFDPAWSPDMSRIAFTSKRDGNREIYIMNADGSGFFNLTNHLSDDEHPAWSPDGLKIAFTRSDDIWVMNADRSGIPLRLTTQLGYDGEPTWSPDGSKIAFVSYGGYSSPDSPWGIFVVNLANGVIGRLTTNPGGLVGLDYQPAWSPDGSEIAFTRWVTSASAPDIYVVDATYGELGPIAYRGALRPFRRLTTYPGFDDAPTWSPDGSKIAFASRRTGNTEIYVMNATDGESSGIVPLTTHPASDFLPSWGQPPLLRQ